MKLTTFIMIIALAQVSAKGLAQKITLNVSNTPIEKVLQSIRQQSGYEFIYNVNDLKGQKISLNIRNVSVEDAVAASIKNLDLDYKIREQNIVLKKREKGLLDNIIARFQAIDVRGKVVDSLGNGLSGVTVSIKEGKGSTSTGGNGDFFLKNVEEGSMLIFSYLGYISKEVPSNKDFMYVQLQQSTSKLDEVQIMAYGVTSRRLTTGNISTVKGDLIAKSPVANPLLAIAGRVPGLFVQQSSGLSTGGTSVLVQGRNSMANNNIPFYVIDGIPYQPNAIGSPAIGTGINPSGNPSALNFINANDIESIEILKDGDATAIYGSRAANGAILITTKTGKAGKTKVDINTQTGWGTIVSKLDLLKTQDYLEMRKESYTNAGQSIPGTYDGFGGNSDLTVWDQNRYTDWQKQLIGGTAQYQNFQASISGGNENTQFLFSSSYLRETTVFPGEFSDIKGSSRLVVNHTSSNRKFKVNFTAGYLKGKNTLPQVDLTADAVSLAPNAPALYNPDGSLNWEPLPEDPKLLTFDNPMARMLQLYTNKVNSLTSNGLLSYEFFPGLTLKSTLGYNRLVNDEIGTFPKAALSPSNTFSKRAANYSNKFVDTWIVEPQLTYSRKFTFGSLDAILGTTFQETRNNMRSYRGEGFNNDSQLENILAAPNVTATGALESFYRYGAIFGRLSYNYEDKYVLTVSGRRDGSSRFGAENLFNNFYSVAGAWIFTNASKIKEQLPFLSFGKLKASYGTTGNDGIGDYKFMNLYEPYPADVPYQQTIGLVTNGLPNPYLQWEETKKINLGIDLGFIRDKILLNVNFFRNRSANQLLNAPLSSVTGFAGITRNLPATVQNKGWEFSLDLNPVRKKTFSWQSSFNLTIPKNKLVRYDKLAESPDASFYVLGESIFIKRAYNFKGVNPTTGLYQFLSKSGDLVSSPSGDDRTEIVNLDPKFYGGWSNSLSYKGFNFDFLFQFVKQNGNNSTYPLFPGAGMGNQMDNFIDRWRKEGDNATIQKVTQDFFQGFFSSLAMFDANASISDASFIRLRNATVSYSLPQSWLGKAKISQARIYMQGQNLLTFTNFYGFDPETRSKNSLPPLRVYTIGLQLSL